MPLGSDNCMAIAEYQEAFNFFDANNDGYITIEELEGAMNKCDQFPTKLELKLLMKQADKDRTLPELALLIANAFTLAFFSSKFNEGSLSKTDFHFSHPFLPLNYFLT